MIVVRLDDQGAVLEFMDWRDSEALPDNVRAATDAEIASLSPPPTDAEIAAAVQAWLDATAQQHQYNDLLSAISYSDDATVPLWQQQGQAFRSWRTQVWQSLFQLQAQVVAGTAQPPATIEALIAQLPQPSIPS